MNLDGATVKQQSAVTTRIKRARTTLYVTTYRQSTQYVLYGRRHTLPIMSVTVADMPGMHIIGTKLRRGLGDA